MSSEASSKKKIQTIGIRSNGPGAGKDTAAICIIEYLRLKGLTVRHEKFATPIRECVQSITGVSIDESQTTEGKNKIFKPMDITIGKFLQLFGVEIVKNNTYDNIWIDALFRRFKEDEIIVISDVRFPNEQEAIKKRNGIVIYVHNEIHIDEKALAGRDIHHSSERALDGVESDFVVKNSELLQFKEDIENIVECFF